MRNYPVSMSEQVTTISAKDVVHLKTLYIFGIAQLFVHMDSHSSSDEGIGGFPQQLECKGGLIWSIFDTLTRFLAHFGAFR